MVAARRGAGSLESEILATLWAADQPLTAADVAAALNDRLAPTTVLTVLGRLQAKGAVSRVKAGRAFAYSPVLDQAGLAARRMRALLDRGGDQVEVLQRFLGTLSPQEEALVARLVKDQGRVGGDR